jgi:hypothetical protein
MAASSYSSYRARISFDPTESSRAPVDEGQLSGYFDDHLTRELLGLGNGDLLLQSGTYGAREPGQAPFPFSLIREGPSDRRLLPFVPRRFSDVAFPYSMHDRNGQFFIPLPLLRAQREELGRIVRRVLTTASDVGRSPPEYLRELVPRVTYDREPFETVGAYQDSFPYQFLPYFTPSGSRARWIRIWRLLAIGEGYLQLCTAAFGSTTEWQRSPPVGLRLDCVPRAEDLPLFRAYRRLGVLMEGHVPNLDLTGFTEIDALQILLGPRAEELPPSMLQPAAFLEPTDDDGLVWSVVNEGYDATLFNEFGYTQTRRDRRIRRAELAEEAQQATGTEEDHGYPADVRFFDERISPEQAESRELVPYGVQGLRSAMPSTSNLLLPPPGELSTGPSTPTSTSGQTSALASSRHDPSDGSGPHRRPRQTNRSRDFQGTPRAPRRRKGPKGPRFSGGNTEPLGDSSAPYHPYSSTRPRDDADSSASLDPFFVDNRLALRDQSLALAESAAPSSRPAPLTACK